MADSGVPQNRLVGTWQLVSASSTTQAGERNQSPYGTEPTGLLTYTNDGRVTALISYGGRKPLRPNAGAEERAEAFSTFFAYAGRYTFNGDQIIHHVEISSIQNYVKRDLVRQVQFQGNQITLTTPPTPVNGVVQTVQLIWERLDSLRTQ